MTICAAPDGGVICPAELHLATLESPRSRDTLTHVLRTLTTIWPRGTGATGCPWHAPTYADLVRLWAVVQTRRLAVPTRRLYRCAIRGVLRQSYHLGTIDAATWLRLQDAVPQPHGRPAPGGRALGLVELHELIDVLATDATIRGARDRAVVGVLYGTGMRVGELCGLRDPEDVHDDGHTLRVHGKGDRPRDAYLEDARAVDYLAAWRAARGPAAGWLFCALRTLAFIDASLPLRPRQVARMLDDAARAAHLGHLTPHDLRRTYATLMADRVPLDVLQRLLGHASIETTRLYIRRDDEQLRAAARRLPQLGGSDGETAAAAGAARRGGGEGDREGGAGGADQPGAGADRRRRALPAGSARMVLRRGAA